MRHLLFLIGALMAGFSHTSAQPIVHLASPIRLQQGVTPFYPTDYFLDPTCLEDIQWPDGLEVLDVDGSDAISLGGNIAAPLAFASFLCDGQTYHIPIVKSNKKQVTITVPAAQLQAEEVYIFGSFNGWNRTANKMTLQNGSWSATLEVAPIAYEYLLLADGKETPDPNNPNKVSNGSGGFNSRIDFSENHPPAATLTTERFENQTIFLAALPKSTQIEVLWQNERVAAVHRTEKNVEIQVPESAANIKRSYLRVFGWNNHNRSNDLMIPLEFGVPIQSHQQLDRSDWEANILYSVMVDRFKNGNPSNDAPLNTPEVHPNADFFGGDVTGLSQVVEAGYFDFLHVNAIWLSPITKNPADAWGLWDKGGVKTKFSGYHGYWPVSNIQPDPRFGTRADIQHFLATAHQNEMNVLLDYVANHVHQNHPVYQNHPEWATDLYLPDGTLNTEKWDEHRLTTWFDTFMPTLDLRKKEVVDPMSDSALVWLKEYDFDGFRHDATKHIDEKFWRTLTAKIKAHQIQNNRSRVYQIGETYGAPELIASYISSGMLDAQFDFNLYDALCGALLETDTAWHRLAGVLQASLEMYGYHHLMGNISGNHDRPRFTSLAGGQVSPSEDPKLAGWTRNITAPETFDAYQKMALVHAFNCAIPGIPTIYYGDEYGAHGANDPDNRRWMQFDSLTTFQENLRNQVRVFTHFRRTELPLIYGTTSWELQDEGRTLVIKRQYFKETVTLIFTLQTPSKPRKKMQMPYSDLLFYNGKTIKAKKDKNGALSLNWKAQAFTTMILKTTLP